MINDKSKNMNCKVLMCFLLRKVHNLLDNDKKKIKQISLQLSVCAKSETDLIQLT